MTSRETECVDWCVQTLTKTKKIWWVKTRPIGPQTQTECSKSHGRKSKKCDQLMKVNSWDMFRVLKLKCGSRLLKLQKVKGDGVAASWWIGLRRRWCHHRHTSSYAAASGTGPESGSEPAVGEALCREEQWVTSDNVIHGWFHMLNVIACVQSVSSPPTGGKPVSKWTTWLTSSTFRRLSGPPEMFLWECTKASGGHKHTSMTKRNPLPQWRRLSSGWDCHMAVLGWWVCTVTASWRASPRGT